jgi:proteasome lid subunit RPN8/RPN11
MLYLPADVRDAIAAAAREGYPLETCGLLVGRGLRWPAGQPSGAREAREADEADESGKAGQAGEAGEPEVRVEAMVAARNLDTTRAHDRYELDPADMLRADAGARARRLDLVGVWHSHPDHPARPSETDERAAWEGWSYLIASVGRRGVTDLRSWRLAGGSFVEEPLVVVGDGGRP